jgi:hypothetical protein
MSDAIKGNLNEDGVMIDPQTGHPVQWRRGDESTETIEDKGETIHAETADAYKMVGKPDDFNAWSLDKRAGWRAGIDAAYDVFGAALFEAHLRSTAARLLDALNEV